MLERLVTYVIPSSLLERSDIGAAQRQLRLAVAIPLLAISGMLYAIPFFWMGLTGPALVSLVLGGGVLSGPWLLRWVGSVNVLAHLLTTTAFLHLTLIIGVTGGLDSVGVPWLINAMLLALLLADRQAALFWLGVALAEVGALYALERTGIQLPNYVPPSFELFLDGIAAAGMVVVAFGLAYLFRRESDHAIRVLAEARHEAEAATDRAESMATTLREQRDQIEEQAEHLRTLDAAKNRFFANVSHELRTPLTLMLGPLRQLRDQLDDRLSEAEAHRLGLVARSGRRLQRLIEQVLDLVELDAGMLALQVRPLPLGDTVQRIASMYDSFADQHGLTLQIEVDSESEDENVEPIYADPTQLEHVVGNLVSNAIKFTPEGGHVTVHVSETPSHGVVSVADSGVGIPPEDQDQVFERFEQAASSAEASRDSTGIGLAFVKELVELHGGTIDLESAVGDGTTMTVRLPRGTGHLGEDHVVEAPNASPEIEEFGRGGETGAIGGVRDDQTVPEAADSQASDTDRTTVLVVDDDPEVRAYVRSVLAPDFRVTEAADGQEGLDRATEHPPDCILADLMMPRMDGVTMAARLKDDPATECIPLLMLTARAADADELEGLAAGADDYVTKPFNPDVLRARVHGQVELRRRLRRRIRAELAARSGDGQTDEAAREKAPQLVVPTPSESETDFVARVRGAVEDHLVDPELTVEDVAGAVAVSRSTLYRRLKEEADCTPSAFIRQVRLQHGARLLREQEGTISEVAYAVGFNSLTYFSRSFREHFDVAPSEFVKREA